jgi:hypothetical protein
MLSRLPWGTATLHVIWRHGTQLTTLTVSSRLEDFSAQRTALVMKAALAAELGDDAGVKEAEDLEIQLMRDNEEMLNAR